MRNPYDVNDDGVVTPLDALTEIAYLNDNGGGPLPLPSSSVYPPPYYDVSGSGIVTPLDVLLILAYLENPSGFTTTTADEQVTTYSYDVLNRLTSETVGYGTAAAATTSYAYNANGDQTSLTDPDGNTTTFSYDHLDRLVGETRHTYESATAPNALVSESMAYDAAGNLTSETDFDGRTRYFQYDNLNRQTAELWGSLTDPTATFTYAYDADGELTSAIAPASGVAPSNTVAFGYDNLGNVVTDTFTGNGYSAPVTITNTYDANNNRLSSSLAFGATADYTNLYTYDSIDRLTDVIQSGLSGGDAVALKGVSLTYNADVTVHGLDSSDGAGFRSRFALRTAVMCWNTFRRC